MESFIENAENLVEKGLTHAGAEAIGNVQPKISLSCRI